MVTAREATVAVYTARSQSVRAMGAKEFQKSKSDVLDELASHDRHGQQDAGTERGESGMTESPPTKPPYGAACNGCGLCCMSQPCPLGRSLFDQEEGRCPALEWHAEHGRFSCGLVTRPERYAPCDRLDRFGSRPLSEAAGLTVGVAVGCDAQVQGERVGLLQGWLIRPQDASPWPQGLRDETRGHCHLG